MILPIFTSDVTFHKDLTGGCYYNAALQIMEYYGIKDPVQYLDTSLQIQVELNDDLSYRYKNNFQIFNQRFQDKVESFESKDADSYEVWEKNKSAIDEGIPVIVDVDLWNLQYLKKDREYHNKHSIILAGYENNTPYLMDVYSWVFRGPVELELYLKGRSALCPMDASPFSGTPVNNKWITISPDGWESNPEGLFKEFVERCLHEQYGHQDDIKRNLYCGIYTTEKMLDIVKMCKAMQPEERMNTMNILHKMVVLFQARYSCYAYYLNYMSKKYHVQEGLDMAELENECNNHWLALSRLIIKYFYSDNMSLLDKVIEKVTLIHDADKKRYEMLSKLNKVL